MLEVAQELVAKYGGLTNIAIQSPESLQKGVGIGRDKAATLVAAFELTRRIDSKKKWISNKNITSPQDVADIFIPLLRDELKEKFIVVCLSSANKIIKYETISVGNLNSSIVHPREVFKVAIDNNSANIIVLHNHPSGNPEPSKEDINVTKQLIEAGKYLDINLFDHIIVAGDTYTSLIQSRLI